MYHTRDYRHCEAKFCNGKMRIDELEAENAALKNVGVTRHADDATLAYIAQLEEENAALKEQVADHQLLFKDYAAAQHRIKQLRGALKKIGMGEARDGCIASTGDLIDMAYDALSTPDSTTELDAVMKDAESWRNLENKMTAAAPKG